MTPNSAQALHWRGLHCDLVCTEAQTKAQRGSAQRRRRVMAPSVLPLQLGALQQEGGAEGGGAGALQPQQQAAASQLLPSQQQVRLEGEPVSAFFCDCHA